MAPKQCPSLIRIIWCLICWATCFGSRDNFKYRTYPHPYIHHGQAVWMTSLNYADVRSRSGKRIRHFDLRSNVNNASVSLDFEIYILEKFYRWHMAARVTPATIIPKRKPNFLNLWRSSSSGRAMVRSMDEQCLVAVEEKFGTEKEQINNSPCVVNYLCHWPPTPKLEFLNANF